MVRELAARTRGEAAMYRELESKSRQHKVRAVELEAIVDILTLRGSQLLTQCNTSSKSVQQCSNLKNSICTLNQLADAQGLLSQELDSEIHARQSAECSRQQKVYDAVVD